MRKKKRQLYLQDLRWSVKVKEKSSGVCQYCGKQGSCASHIIPRGRLRTRYILENGLYFCFFCHKKYDNNKEFREFIIETLVSKKVYKKLRKIADGRSYKDYGFEKVN